MSRASRSHSRASAQPAPRRRTVWLLLACKDWKPILRARDVIGRLTNWRIGRLPRTEAHDVEAIDDADAYKIAFEAGALAEQARIAAIVRLPCAEHFPRLALSLALSGVVSLEQAYEAFRAAGSDVLARSQPTESSYPNSATSVAPATIH